MARWRILLLPPAGMRRARARWLRADGGFSVHGQQAWQVAEPRCAAQRVQRWLQLKGRGAAMLERMRLVHGCSNPAAEATSSQRSPIGCR
jgi:hypothetical protein